MDTLGLFSLQCWSLRGDLIEVYAIMRGIDRVDRQNLLPKMDKSKTGGRRIKVRGAKFKEDMQGTFCAGYDSGFTDRCVDVQGMEGYG